MRPLLRSGSFCLFHFLSCLLSGFFFFLPSFIQGFSNILVVGLRPTHVWQIWLIVSRLEQIIEVNGFSETFHSAPGWNFERRPDREGMGISSWLFLSSAQCVREGLFSRGLLTSPHVKLSNKDETGRRMNGVHAGHLDHNLFCAHVCAAKHTHHMRRHDFDTVFQQEMKMKFIPVFTQCWILVIVEVFFSLSLPDWKKENVRRKEKNRIVLTSESSKVHLSKV